MYMPYDDDKECGRGIAGSEETAMMTEMLGRAIQADREREIREALRARAMTEGRGEAPESSAPSRHPARVPEPPARPGYARPGATA
jgi:hypothetical protein